MSLRPAARRLRRYAAATLAAALLVTLTAPALGADIGSVKGDKYRMAKTKMAKSLTRFADPAGDQLRLDGAPAPGAPKWSDIKAVRVAATKMPPKLIGQMADGYPPGAEAVFYGKGQTPRSGDRVVFVAVEMARRLPNDSLGQQVEIGFSGREASPVQNGAELTSWAGTERFTLAGLFSDGRYGVGATDVSGRDPGLELEPDEYYNARTGALGFYDPRRATWYAVLPRPGDADAINVSVRSSTGVGSVIDRLDLPGGGHFIDLRSPGGGYRAKTEGALLTCRALETFNGESSTVEELDADSNLVRYSAGVEAGSGGRKVLAAAIEAAGPVSVTVAEVGSEEEPSIVAGELTVWPDGNVVSLEFEVPEGQWTFALADELELKTPAGESIVDHATLTGPAGVQVGPGLDGFVAGNPACAPSLEAETEEDTSATEEALEDDGAAAEETSEPA
jgi:hypothetical protein